MGIEDSALFEIMGHKQLQIVVKVTINVSIVSKSKSTHFSEILIVLKHFIKSLA